MNQIMNFIGLFFIFCLCSAADIWEYKEGNDMYLQRIGISCLTTSYRLYFKSVLDARIRMAEIALEAKHYQKWKVFEGWNIPKDYLPTGINALEKDMTTMKQQMETETVEAVIEKLGDLNLLSDQQKAELKTIRFYQKQADAEADRLTRYMVTMEEQATFTITYEFGQESTLTFADHKWDQHDNFRYNNGWPSGPGPMTKNGAHGKNRFEDDGRTAVIVDEEKSVTHTSMFGFRALQLKLYIIPEDKDKERISPLYNSGVRKLQRELTNVRGGAANVNYTMHNKPIEMTLRNEEWFLKKLCYPDWCNFSELETKEKAFGEADIEADPLDLILRARRAKTTKDLEVGDRVCHAVHRYGRVTDIDGRDVTVVFRGLRDTNKTVTVSMESLSTTSPRTRSWCKDRGVWIEIAIEDTTSPTNELE